MLKVFKQLNSFKERIAIESEGSEFSYAQLIERSDLIASFLLDEEKDLMEEKITKIDSLYIQTNKNEQVKGFYDNCLFSKVKSINGAKEYSLIVANYISKTKDYIKIINE